MMSQSFKKTIFPKSWNTLRGIENQSNNPYAQECRIPLGTKRPIESYEGDIPDDEIVYINFEPIDTPFTEREAFNILLLGSSGDGKSLILKQIWKTLHDANYYCLYFDPKSCDSGRASKPFPNNRLPPRMKPEGIKLKHYLPIFATKDFDHLIHNFKVYSLRLKNIDEKYMWLGLGFSPTGASKISKIIAVEPKITLNKLMALLPTLQQEEGLNKSALNSMYNKLIDIQDLRYLDSEIPEINIMEDFQKGYSVCISYNAREKILLSFDVGEKIRRCKNYFNSYHNRNPIMIFLDDSSFYAKKIEGVESNYAVEEIRNIGFNYRSLGVYNCMAVQSLGIIDQAIAETYKIKLISPLFENYDSLREIGLNLEVVALLKNNQLVKDKERRILEWIMIDKTGNFQTFFPFLPPCNHFTEVYRPKEESREQVSDG